MQYPNAKIPSLIALSVGILLHLALAFVPVRSHTQALVEPHRGRDPVFVVEPDERKLPLAATEFDQKWAVDPKNSEKAKARFFAQQQNRTERETQAAQRGPFQAGGRLHRSKASQGSGAVEEEDVGAVVENEGIPEAAAGVKKGKRGVLELSDLMIPSSSPDRLPDDIKKGDQTLLNADEVQFSSFIFRVRDRVYDTWRRRLQEADRYLAFNERPLKPKNYVTVLGVLLNEVGEVTTIEVLETSGVMEIDEAPKLAFWDAKSFPNPPKQLFSETGFIRFVYRFEYQVENAVFNVIPNVL